ncbi:MAG: hypothetical protein KAW02_02025 [candidate division Zixibacteria bacterium]|nr:hypothetical protein [candidate division Zixibacteria bacterium]
MQLKNQNSVPCHSERSEESKETLRFAQGDNTFSSTLPPELPFRVNPFRVNPSLFSARGGSAYGRKERGIKGGEVSILLFAL